MFRLIKAVIAKTKPHLRGQLGLCLPPLLVVVLDAHDGAGQDDEHDGQPDAEGEREGRVDVALQLHTGVRVVNE